MRDLLALFLVEARDAWSLLILLAAELLTRARAMRVDEIRDGATPPWWRDRAFMGRCRREFVKQLYVVVGIVVTFVWANHARLDGAARLVTIAVGLTSLLRMWANLARGDAFARLIQRAVTRVVEENAADPPPPADPPPADPSP